MNQLDLKEPEKKEEPKPEKPKPVVEEKPAEKPVPVKAEPAKVEPDLQIAEVLGRKLVEQVIRAVFRDFQSSFL